MAEDFTADVARLAALNEPVRRDLYRYVVAQDQPVSRESAAAGVGVAHHVAKFNLDKLVAEGLLDVEYRRPPGRRGPGAGRPPKLYRRAARDISVSVPERHYDLAGQVLAEALTLAHRDGIPLPEALRSAAHTAGRKLATNQAPQARPVTGPEPHRVCRVLSRNGYEPRATPDGVVLTNCPFHDLASKYVELVCTMNLDLIDGVLEQLGAAAWRACLNPAPGRCCVTIQPRQSSGSRCSD